MDPIVAPDTTGPGLLLTAVGPEEADHPILITRSRSIDGARMFRGDQQPTARAPRELPAQLLLPLTPTEVRFTLPEVRKADGLGGRIGAQATHVVVVEWCEITWMDDHRIIRMEARGQCSHRLAVLLLDWIAREEPKGRLGQGKPTRSESRNQKQQIGDSLPEAPGNEPERRIG